MSKPRVRAEMPEGPGPLTAGIVGPNGQCQITSDYFYRRGEWEDIYVDLSGFCGSYGPHVFAAAPDLLAALKAMVLNDAHTYRDCHKAALAAIAKAEGR